MGRKVEARKSDTLSTILDSYAQKYADYVLGNNLSAKDPETTIGFLYNTEDGKEFLNKLSTSNIDLKKNIRDIFVRFANEVSETKIRDILREAVVNDPSAEIYSEGKKILPPGKTKKGYSVGVVSSNKEDND